MIEPAQAKQKNTAPNNFTNPPGIIVLTLKPQAMGNAARRCARVSLIFIDRSKNATSYVRGNSTSHFPSLIQRVCLTISISVARFPGTKAHISYHFSSSDNDANENG